MWLNFINGLVWSLKLIFGCFLQRQYTNLAKRVPLSNWEVFEKINCPCIWRCFLVLELLDCVYLFFLKLFLASLAFYIFHNNQTILWQSHSDWLIKSTNSVCVMGFLAKLKNLTCKTSMKKGDNDKKEHEKTKDSN